MPLSAGARLGHYEIVSPIGAGGMGEVYKARDTRLDRTVAVKVLPSHIAARDDLRARFEREARAVSSLNHPHICTLHDVGREGDIDYMVMEHLEGESLFDRLQKGPLPVDQALKYAQQIADAVDRAHRSGVVHRDLKPGNIMLTRDGAKVLDFGLAKSAPKASQDGATLTAAITTEGTVLGTPQYMSPEQIEGKEADARSDIFAFGCVLYEMVTGRRAFDGKTKASVMGAILSAEPPPMSAVQPITPRKLDRVVQRCLIKDADERYQSLWDVLLELRSLDAEPEALPKRKRAWLPWAVSLVLAAAAVGFAFLWPRSPVPELRATQFLLHPPNDTLFTTPNAATAVSPDGRYLVFGVARAGAPALWLRPLDSLEARPLQGSEGGLFPFWSPDSRSVAFFADGKLKRSDIVGGAPQVLCDIVFTEGPGGTWNREGTILFAGTEGLMQVPSSGGVPRLLTRTDTARKESSHGVPQFLPDGQRFLYFIASSDPNIQGIYAGSLDDSAGRLRILATDRKADYAPPQVGRTGYLLWLRERTLLAQPFDEANLRLTGEPTPVAEGVSLSPVIRAAYWTSDAGLLVYRTGLDIERPAKLVWISREGKRLGEAGKEGRYASFRLSPDGTRAALSLAAGDHQSVDVWVLEFARGVMTRLTFDPKDDGMPLWSPDGRQIAFYSNRSGPRQVYRKDAGGGGREEQLTTDAGSKFPSDWSPDGRLVLYVVPPGAGPDGGGGLWVVPVDGNRKAIAVHTNQRISLGSSAQFSPDGNRIAYAAADSSRSEVYVRSFPESVSQWQVSTQGGSAPKWRADGKELFYVGPERDSILAAAVRGSGGTFQSDMPRELFRVARLPDRIASPYEVTDDGRRFLVLQPTSEREDVAPLTVVMNWQAGLKK